jgi:ketosteroid isomerase-like protein
MAVLALPLLGGCGQAPDRHAAVDVKAEEAKLMDLSRRWSAVAAEGKDADAVARYWADDAILMQDKVPTIRGRAAARAMVVGAFKTPGIKIQGEPLEAHVAASGDLADIIERSTVAEPGADGKPVTEQARAVTVWRKDANGEWRNAVDISNAEVKAE